MAKQSKPAIRFKGFTDAWEQRKLTEFVEFFSGLTYTPNDVQENGTLVLRSSNVSNGEVVNADNVYVNPQVVNSENVKVGDIVVVVRNGSRSLIGKHAQIKAFMPNTVIGAFMTGIRSECPEFTNALLNTSRFEEEIAMNMGATINQITGYMFSKMEFKVPCLDEQKKIGEYFEKLDNLITLHQRKYDKLQVLKKAMLEKMFPKNGSSVPEIRFKGFTDAWEQRKLGALCVEFKSGDFISASDIAENEAYPVYGGNGLRGFTNHYNHDGEYALIGRQGALCGNVNYAVGKSYFTEHAVAVRANKTNQTRFLYYLFSTMNLGQYSGQSAQPGLAVGNLVELENVVPSKPEQEKIASFLSSLDNLITLHQRELEKLQNIKKSMLEKMFV